MNSQARIQQSLPAVAGVIAAATLLGVAYNAASPLGVRSRAGTPIATATPIQTATTTAPAASAAPPGATQATPATAPPPAPTGYQNQTLSMALEPAVPMATAPAPLPPLPERQLRSTPAAGSTIATPTLPTTTALTNAPQPVVITTLAWPQVKEAMARGNVVLVDARAAAQYQGEHIPGAVSLPAGTAAPEIAAFVAKHGKEKTYIVYCGSGQCGLSKTVAESLRKLGGATDVKTFPGGYAEYRLSEQKPATP